VLNDKEHECRIQQCEERLKALAVTAIAYGRVQGEPAQPQAETLLKEAALAYFKQVRSMRQKAGLPTPK